MNNLTCRRLLLLAFFCFSAQYAEAKEKLNTSNLQKKAPLSFYENKGQVTDQNGTVRNDIDYKINVGELSVFIGDGQLHYQWTRDNKPQASTNDNSLKRPTMEDMLEQRKKSSLDMYRLDVTLEGANKAAKAIAGEMQQYEERYIKGKLNTTVKTYNKITYQDVYPNIDWVLYSDGSELKYDFVVKEGGDLKKIKLRYDGATSLALKEGKLVAQTPMGSITEDKPYTYDAKTKEEYTSSFVLNGNVLSFNVTQGKHGIVIDPRLDWATYYGGSAYDGFNSLVLDTAGNIYAAGYTYSSSNIATTGAHKTSLTTGSFDYYDGMIVKFNASGVRQWGTYYGGAGYDWVASIAYDGLDGIYFCGSTESDTGIATPGAHDTSYNNPGSVLYWYGDAFLAKMNLSGVLQWGTYYGGSSYDWASALAVSGSDIYICGNTHSDTGIATAGAYKTVINSVSSINYNYDAFVAKFNTSGTRIWGTYYGGANYEYPSNILVDASGNVLMVGTTNSDTGIATSGSYQPSISGTTVGVIEDGFFTRFSSSGTLLYGSYYGGPLSDGIGNAAIDHLGNIYMVGVATSATNIATPGPAIHKSSKTTSTVTSTEEGFIVKFNSSLTRLWGSYFGGANTTINAVQTDSMGVYIAGSTTSPVGIATDGFPTNQGQDHFVGEFSHNGTLMHSRYFGGPSVEPYNYYYNYGFNSGLGSDINRKTKKFYVAGQTYSSTGIATSGAHQTTLGSSNNYDGYLACFDIDTIPYIALPFTDTSMCAGNGFEVIVKVNRTFNPGNVFTIQLSDATGSFSSPTSIGSDIATGEVGIPCTLPSTLVVSGNYRIRVVSSSPVRVSEVYRTIGIGMPPLPRPVATTNGPICERDTLKLYGATTATLVTRWVWTGPNAFLSTVQNPRILNATASATGEYILTTLQYGCFNSDTINITVKPSPIPNAGADFSICATDTLKLSTTTTLPGMAYKWTGPNSFASVAKDTFITNSTTGMSGKYALKVTTDGCSATDTVVATVKSLPANFYAQGDTACTPDNAYLYATTSSAGVGFAWTGPGTFSASTASVMIPNPNSGMSGDYVITATLNGCSIKDTVPLLVYPRPAKPVATYSGAVCEGVSVSLSATTSTTGVTYRWTGPNGYISDIQNPSFVATGNSGGDYIVTITNSGGCSMSDTVNVVIFSLPSKPVAASNSPVCENGTINLSTPAASFVSYDWTGPNGFTASGATSSVSNITTANAGEYIVTATANGCMAKDTVEVVVKTMPAVPSVSTNSPVCINTTLNLSAGSNTPNVDYNWTGPNGFTYTGTGTGISNVSVANAGIYYVTATLNGCTSAAGSANVVIGINTPTPVATSTNQACIGGSFNLMANAIAGASYSWAGPNGFASTQQNPTVHGVNNAMAGTYTVIATVDGCVSAPGSTSITVNAAPFVNIHPTPNDTICTGGTLTMVAIGINPGTGTQYSWIKNGISIPGANSTSYSTSAVTSGDVFICTMTNVSGCGLPFKDSSLPLTIQVMPFLTPTVSITASPEGLVKPWQMITFTATATNEGLYPSYQWKRNGQDVVGATQNTWGADNLSNVDTISVVLKSSYICATPASLSSNQVVVNIATGVGNVTTDGGLMLYPNPNRGSFTIAGFSAGKVKAEVINAIGQIVHSETKEQVKGSVPINANLAPGNYLVRITLNDANQQLLKFTVRD